MPHTTDDLADSSTTEDAELLRQYTEEGSEGAYVTLMKRHMDMVYSTALRQLRDTALAQDVCQVVFVLLAQKAPELKRGVMIQGWLYRTAVFASKKALRGEIRRHQREQKAAEMKADESEHKSWENIAPILDDALAALVEADRNAIVLRYFGDKDLKEVGRAMGISDDAAQKRISRALTKLRHLLLKRGVSLPLSALATLLAAETVHATPPAVCGAVISTFASGLPHKLQWLAAETLKSLQWAKIPVAPVATVAALIVVVVSINFALSENTSSAPRTITTASTSVSDSSPKIVALPIAAIPMSRPNIHLKLLGTSGLSFELTHIEDGNSNRVTGFLPNDVWFQADAYSILLNVQGGGEFGYELYRDDVLQSSGATRTIPKAERIRIDGRKGGRGVQVGTMSGNLP